MQFSRYRSAREEVEINLIPVMNLFVTIIPFLLLAAAFYHVGVVPTSLPSQTSGNSDIAGNDKAVTVDLLIEKAKIELTVSNSVLPEEIIAQLAMTIPNKDGKHDLEELRRAIIILKQRYPESDTVVVLPTDEVQYKHVIKILDATREIPNPKPGGKPEPLLPVVVLSRKL